MDQVHEQNNKFIKVVGGAVRLLYKDLDPALRCWKVVGPEAFRLLEGYKRLYNITSNKNKGKHPNYYTKFQRTTFKNYFSTFMKFATFSRRID